MRQKVGFIKSVLWMVVVLAALLLMLVIGLRVLGAETSVEGSEVLPPASEAAAPLPEIVISQRDGHLRASVEAGIAEWRYAGPNASAACDSAFFATTATVRTGREVILDSADYGRYYCFRASAPDSHIYHAHLVVDNRPHFTVEQDLNAAGESVLRAVSAQAADSWQSVGPLAAGSCLPASFEIDDISPKSGQELIIAGDTAASESEPPAYYCFRARGQTGEWGFAGRYLETSRLTLTWQNADGLLEVNSENWPESQIGEYVVKDVTASSCSMEDFVERGDVGFGNTIPVNSSAAGYYCFRIKDGGNTYHYGDYLLPG